MAKWHAYGRCKNRLSKDIGKISSAKVQKKMTGHTISVAKFLENKGLIDISLAISGLGLKNSKRWSNELGIKNFKLQGKVFGDMTDEEKENVVSQFRGRKKVNKQTGEEIK